MPVNPTTGQYTLPNDYEVSPGGSIDASWSNANLEDLETAINSRLWSGGGSFTSPVLFADGDKADPGISWSNATGVGFYRDPISGFQRMVMADVDVMQFTSSGMQQWDNTGSFWYDVQDTRQIRATNKTTDTFLHTPDVTPASSLTSISGTVDIAGPVDIAGVLTVATGGPTFDLIETDTTDLNVRTGLYGSTWQMQVVDDTDPPTFVRALMQIDAADGETRLYYNGSNRLKSTSTGVTAYSRMTLEGSAPEVYLDNTSEVDIDLRQWRVSTDNPSGFIIQALSDAGAGGGDFFRLTRGDGVGVSKNQVESIRVGGPTDPFFFADATGVYHKGNRVLLDEGTGRAGIPVAMGRYTAAGAAVGSQIGHSIVKVAVGTYAVTLNAPVVDADDVSVAAAYDEPSTTGIDATTYQVTGVDTLTIYTKSGGGALADRAFSFEVYDRGA
jgi:hypothetical protein